MTESPNALPIANPQVIFRRVGDGAVLLSLEDEVYYGLNAVGARVWEFLAESSRGVDELVDALQLEYREVDRDVIWADVNELLRDLTENGLVAPVQAPDLSSADSSSTVSER